VYEYIKKFNYLVQYNTDHVDTDEKKAKLFGEGQSIPLQNHLVLFCDLSFNALMSAVIDQEGTYRSYLDAEEKKRKRAMSGPSEDSTWGASPKYHLVYTPLASKSRFPPPPPQWDHRPPQQQQMLPRAPVHSHQLVPLRARQQTIVVSASCFNYGRVGHFAR
jgi:hypothetical protein